MKRTTTVSALAFAGLLTMASAPAFAQENECEADSDCPDDFICETISWGACPGCSPDPDEDCPPCESGEQNVCVPPPPQECDADNPCSGDDVCVTYTFETCSGGGAVPVSPDCDPDDASCPPPDDREDTPDAIDCESADESYCVPPYLAPCSQDSDCGAGFTCEAVEVCGCSSGGSTGEPGSDEEPDVEPDCSCEVLADENYCQLIEVECDSDADCAGDLKCQESYEVAVDIACVPDEPCPEPEPVEVASYCAPDDYAYYGGRDEGGVAYADAVAEASGNDGGTVTSSQREEFFPVDGNTDRGDSDKGEPGGCTTASGSDASATGLLFLLGFAGLRRRRRS